MFLLEIFTMLFSSMKESVDAKVVLWGMRKERNEKERVAGREGEREREAFTAIAVTASL